MDFRQELDFFIEYLGEQIASPFGDLPDDDEEQAKRKKRVATLQRVVRPQGSISRTKKRPARTLK